MKKTITSNLIALSKIIFVLTLIPSALLLSGCGQSDVKKCVDEQSHLWDNTRGKSREDNKAYWAAVDKCREKYK